MQEEARCEVRDGSLYVDACNEGRGYTWASGGRQSGRNLVSLSGTFAPGKKQRTSRAYQTMLCGSWAKICMSEKEW